MGFSQQHFFNDAIALALIRIGRRCPDRDQNLAAEVISASLLHQACPCDLVKSRVTNAPARTLSRPHGQIVPSAFRPHPLLPGAHLQTLATLLRPVLTLPLRLERLNLADGDFIDLGWSGEHNAKGPLAVLVHGLTGGFTSKYLLGTACQLITRGWRTVILQLRGAGPEPNRLHRCYRQTLVVHAQDDPFMTADIIPDADALAPQVTLEIAARGGHVGFISADDQGRPYCWLEKRLADHLHDAFELQTLEASRQRRKS